MSNSKSFRLGECVETDFELENRQLMRLSKLIRDIVLYEFPVNLNLSNILTYYNRYGTVRTENLIRAHINEMTRETWGEGHPSYVKDCPQG